ncbi:MAG TPA: DUF4394 domain-containing protein [Phycisphaerae bacterium]|nr:DUF4394 domain-containing protein [Phycisphaerae bacterium]
MRRWKMLSLFGGLSALTLSTTANAELIIGLTTSQQLVRFDSATPGTINGTSPLITGLSLGESIVDIDFYPVNNLLHGLGTTGNLYRIDPFTGLATLDATPQSSLGSPLDIDFNPAADRLRIFSAGDANFRMTPSVGTAGPNGANAGLVTPDGTLSYGNATDPNLVGAAYTNNFDGTATTTLYSLDTGTNNLASTAAVPRSRHWQRSGRSALTSDRSSVSTFRLRPSPTSPMATTFTRLPSAAAH